MTYAVPTIKHLLYVLLIIFVLFKCFIFWHTILRNTFLKTFSEGSGISEGFNFFSSISHEI